MKDQQMIAGGIVLLIALVGWAAWVSGGSDADAVGSAEVADVLPDGDAAGAAFQESLHQAITSIRESCLRGWTDTLPANTSGELVVDAIVNEGSFQGVDLRAVGVVVPEDILRCAEERADAVFWPQSALTGERRFQRTMSLP